MRIASIASTLLFLALLLTASTAEEPVSTPQPTEAELAEISKIRTALGPEFQVASQMFGADLPSSAPISDKSALETDVIDANSPAGNFYLQTTKPSLERAIRFLSIAESDLKALSTPSRNDKTAHEAQQLREAAQKCKQLADQLEEMAKLRAPKATQLR
ncbi:hypothetical protein [Blastopirellula marina]|uniref:Secreted protein n=1 Tax=Blastopirellula marina DSM 3645 TaxID=314230 RepID=A3ZLE0_9BACT|nr:hypothetical protein [Blastopirellula marina]EAQ82573.1 hypothetical protein DSM3645_09247 [Blastopirellula marina DSM 3645]